jgi:tetratricopeptide (TPR) repeat protein
MRYAAVIFAILCLGQLVFAGYVAKMQANARWFEPHDRDQARDVLATLQSVAPYDGETWYRSGRLATTLDEALQDFSKAVDVAPSAKYLRRLAYCQDLAKRQADAETTLDRAVQLDPNNAVTLLQLMTLQDKAGETERAVETAKRLIATESTSYFKIRALPEEIPTETYEARLYLAKSATDKIALVRAAVEGFLQFARVTLPHAQAINPDGTGAGISAREAMDRVKVGLDAAKQLEGLYRSAGDKVGEAWASEAEREFETAVGPSK